MTTAAPPAPPPPDPHEPPRSRKGSDGEGIPASASCGGEWATTGDAHRPRGPRLSAAAASLDAAQLARAFALCDELIAAYRRHCGRGGSQGPNGGAEDELPTAYADLLEALPEVVWITLAAGLDVTIPRAHALAASAFAATVTMPALLAQAQRGRIGFARLDYAAGRAAQLADTLRPEFDERVTALNVELEWKQWKRAVDEIFALLQPPADARDEAVKNRRVRRWSNGDGTACLLYTGPTAEIAAAYQRLTAWARAIALSHAGLFVDPQTGRRLSSAALFLDERTIDQTRFDLGLNGIPQLPLTVLDPSGAQRDMVVRMPTSADWLRKQASVCVTVPFLSLLGDSSLPGRLDDCSPVSAEDARLIAAHAPSLRRLLTDPATGTVLEAVARTYAFPQALKTAVMAKWAWCTVPGCPRRASTADIDHIVPFNRDDPARGGPTALHNLHPLCRRHHLLKTNRQFAVERDDAMRGGGVRWTFPSPLVGPVAAPGSPIDTEHARQVAALRAYASESPEDTEDCSGGAGPAAAGSIAEWHRVDMVSGARLASDGSPARPEGEPPVCTGPHPDFPLSAEPAAYARVLRARPPVRPGGPVSGEERWAGAEDRATGSRPASRWASDDPPPF